MKRIDRLVIKELLGPWVFGVAMFSTLLMAATYLNRIAGYIVAGLPGDLIIKITALLIPAILAKTFAMALLLSGLLSFGRLSSDSEITALRAAGASLYRIMRPVMAMSLLIAIATFIFNDKIVPPAAAEGEVLVTDIANREQGVAGQPVSFPLPEKRGQLMAEAFDILHKTLNKVTISVYNKAGNPTMFVFCEQLMYVPSKTEDKNDFDWRLQGGGFIVQADGTGMTTLTDAEPWRPNVPKPNLKPEDIATIGTHDPDTLSMAQITHEIQLGLRTKSLELRQINNLRYGYWNKISIGLAAFVFGVLGAVLGIRNQRTGTAAGFALAIGIIFCYFAISNFMNVWAMDGLIPAYVASFTPVVIGAVAAGVIMWRRNN